jgi:hypothetical protein
VEMERSNNYRLRLMAMASQQKAKRDCWTSSPCVGGKACARSARCRLTVDLTSFYRTHGLKHLLYHKPTFIG